MLLYCQISYILVWGCRCGQADSVLDSHTTGPRFKTQLLRYFQLSFRLLTTMAASSWGFAGVCVEGRGRISRSALTQDIKIGSCVFQCDVPHQWIAQRQVSPVSVYCDGVGCRVLCLRHAWHFCVAAHWSKYHCYKQAPSWYDLRCLKATLNPNKQTNIFWYGKSKQITVESRWKFRPTWSLSR